MADTSIYFVKLPSLQQLCHVTLQVCVEKFDFHQQVLKCRQLLSICPQAVASPQIENKTLIDAVVHVEFYKKRFAFFCQKLNLKPIQASLAKNVIVESCVLYTVKYKLAPHWNQVGSILVAYQNFLSCHGKLEAVNVDISVTGDEMTIKVKPHLIRIPPTKLENFGICPQALESFYSDANYNIPESAINLQWCHILPTMKKGQVVGVSHKIPFSRTKNNFLNSYDGLRKYWKVQYGYSLPASEDDMVYCSVYFNQISSNLFTYPLICLRSRPIQYMPRCDGPAITKKFFLDLRQRLDKLCGFSLTYAGKACTAVNNLSVASQMKPGQPQNVRIVESQRQSTSKKPLQQVPNRDVILSTQASNSNKDAVCQKVPTLSKSDLVDPKMRTLASFPRTCDGKIIPVFGRRARFVPPKINALHQPQPAIITAPTVYTTGSHARISYNGNVVQCPSKAVVKKKKCVGKQAQLMGPVFNNVSNANTTIASDIRVAATKKHKFDQIFASAASSSSALVPLATVPTSKVKKKSDPKKHKFEQFFSSASNSSSSQLVREKFQNPVLKSRVRKSANQFDSFFKAASSAT